MVQDFYAFPVRAAVQSPAVSTINPMVPADVPTEIDNDFEWLLNDN